MTPNELKKLQTALMPQVQREYQLWSNHVNTWRTEVQGEVRSINEKKEDIYIDLIKENMDFERATFLLDDINVDFVTEDGVIASKQVKNLKSAYKFDFIDTDRKQIQDQIIIDNDLYGIAVEVMDLYDEDENQPISVLINPDTCIPDPRCTSGSGMRFFWFSRKIPEWKLKTDKYYLHGMSVQDMGEDQNLKLSNDARMDDTILSNEWYVDIYAHYTIHEWKKYLTIWVNDRSVLIYATELSALTKAEQMNPMKTKFPVVFHRRKPFPYRWAWYRLWEEVGMEQDIVTQLKKLELAQARISAYWPDTFYASSLGIDHWKMQKLKEGGRMAQVNIMPNESISSKIFTKNYETNTAPAQNMSEWALDRVRRNTGYWDLQKGISPTGSQTKGEIQQLAQEASKYISWVSTNYLTGERDYVFLWYRSYQEFMPKKSKKIIALFDKGGMARTIRKEEFITDGKLIINVTSAGQEKIKNEKAVTKLLALSQTILPTLKSEYAINTFTRTLVDKSGVEWIEWETLVPLSYDEQLALSRVEMINNNIPIISKPQPWEDPQTHIDIYSKCLDTESRRNIIKEYQRVLIEKKQLMPEMPAQVDQGGANLAQNMMVQQSNPNTQPVTTM